MDSEQIPLPLLALVGKNVMMTFEQLLMTEDLKEVVFLYSSNGQCIVAGSDDGSFFVWEKATTNILRVLRGDDSIVNCMQPHPTSHILATLGIDPLVRLWSPCPEVR